MKHRRTSLCLALCFWLIAAGLAAADSGRVQTSAGWIWVRSGPSTTSPIIDRLYNGSLVNIIRSVTGQAVWSGNNQWFEIGQGRYVYSGLIQRQESTAPPPISSTPAGERWFEISLSQQRLYAHEGNRIVYSTSVSTGIARYPTVQGTFHIYVKYKSAPMSGPGYYFPRVPNVMYFYRGYAIHGAYWHNNFGRPMSHGCINLSLKDAEWAFRWATVGTKVVIHR